MNESEERKILTQVDKIKDGRADMIADRDYIIISPRFWREHPKRATRWLNKEAWGGAAHGSD